ncbi:MAG: 4-hydroxy-tetrahydrodipicolinate synthase [uncultured Adhaeribacter sp.]|uniref:4-hydroxy-tetrahydrodipicolinate synthase n=1 Tax=uncultured Adhaeribacter sp. TaxID=448109 RepID=A0A6J4HJR4_9BACT|nr:MAG: 4-hydroxy-tetrahydrodipicolinate synthase [uncultured Adhaeribacter sp.]
MKSLQGTGVALVTPFNQDLTIDYTGFGKLLDFTVKGGVDYLVLNGTTGESATTTEAENHEMLAFVKKHIAGNIPLVYGMGGNNTLDVLEFISHTDLTGVEAILSISPYYNKPSQAGIYQHYLQIADASPVPVILYNVPGRTGSNISVETTLQLAQHPNIIGTKEASGNIEQCLQILKDKPSDFMLISGDDLLTIPLIAVGAAGVISVLANAYPEKFSRLTRLALSNNFQEATKLILELIPLNPLLYEEGNPVGIKVILEAMGIIESYVRLPLVPASASLQSRIQKLL